MNWPFLGLFILSITAGASDRKPADWSTAPDCIADPASIPKGTEESVVASLTSKLSDDEMIARLVYAESLAANCFGAKTNLSVIRGVTEGIAWTIQNRVRDERKSGRAIVTKPGQYRSTMGTCDVAQRKAFLCPISNDADEAGAKRIWNEAVQATEHAGAGKDNPLAGIHNYFFPKAFDDSKNCASFRGKFPAWASAANEITLPESFPRAVRSCVRFYRTK